MKTILIHGLGQNAACWEKTIENMGDNADVTSVELSDFVRKENCEYAEMYNRFQQYCDTFHEKINLCGLSLGAVLALNYVIDHPNKINCFIPIAGQYKMPKLLLACQNIMFSFMPEKMFQDMGFGKKSMIQLTKSMMNLNFEGKLNQIQSHTVIICGEKDKANKWAAKKMEERIPNAQIILIKEAGHEINMEKPEELGKILKEYLTHSI